VALPQADRSVDLGWRRLDSDPTDVAIHVYRQTGAADAAQRLTADSVRESTDFIDREAAREDNSRYFVRPVTADIFLQSISERSRNGL
jgi:hypothetical protein